jgi:hypothetical protein
LDTCDYKKQGFADGRGIGDVRASNVNVQTFFFFFFLAIVYFFDNSCKL